MTRSRPSSPVRSVSRPIALRAVAILASLLASASVSAGAQGVAGGGQDAIVVPRGVIRVEASGDWRNWRERFSSAADGSATSVRVPLGSEESGDPFGAAQLPALLPIQTTVRDLARSAALDVSLGAVRTRVDVLSARSVFSLEAGLGARLALLATIPYLQTTAAVSTDIDGTVAGANLGLNPGFVDGSTAGAANAAVVRAAVGARDALAVLLVSCGATPTAPGCGPVQANRAGAELLLAEANTVTGGLTTLYGVDASGGARFVPLTGSAPAAQIAARLTALATAFGGFGITTLPADAALIGATPLTAPQLATAGVGAEGVVERYGIGDIELGAKFLVLDTFGALPGATRPTGPAVRIAIAGLFRYGRNSADSLGDPYDIGVGGGQNDIEGRAHADLALGRRGWISATGRYGVQLADQTLVRAPGAAETLVDRDLGDYIELELVPRFALGNYFALAGVYRFRSKAEDSFTGTLAGTGGGPTVDAALLGFGTQTREQRAGAGLLFSTMDAYARGRAGVPFEVNYVYTRTVAGAGQLVANAAEHRIGARMYVRLFGRGS